MNIKSSAYAVRSLRNKTMFPLYLLMGYHILGEWIELIQTRQWFDIPNALLVMFEENQIVSNIDTIAVSVSIIMMCTLFLNGSWRKVFRLKNFKNPLNLVGVIFKGLSLDIVIVLLYMYGFSYLKTYLLVTDPTVINAQAYFISLLILSLIALQKIKTSIPIKMSF